MKRTLSIAVSAAFVVSAGSTLAETTPTTAEMWEIIQNQQAEIAELKAAQEATAKDLVVTEEKIEATADALESGVGGGSSKALEWAEKTKIGGYGEHHFNAKKGNSDEVDAHRFVLFVGHEFNSTVRFFSEFELEHGVAGEGQNGEVELEQAYIQWDYSQNHSLVAGQFLIPIGILNETHEPETFYGVERNNVEKNIIPATWWETGAMLQGNIAAGLTYNLAIHSGLNNDEANIRSGRQKSAQATANDFAYTGRIKYTGVPGLELAAAIQYQEDLAQSLAVEAMSGVLTEVHIAYSVGDFGLRALAAQWDIDGDIAKDLGRDKQDGWYVEPSYKVTEKLGVFARYSAHNMTAGFTDSDTVKAIDIGLNYWLTPRVAFKADYQDEQNSSNDSFNLGLGWSY